MFGLASSLMMLQRMLIENSSAVLPTIPFILIRRILHNYQEIYKHFTSFHHFKNFLISLKKANSLATLENTNVFPPSKNKLPCYSCRFFGCTWYYLLLVTIKQLRRVIYVGIRVGPTGSYWVIMDPIRRMWILKHFAAIISSLFSCRLLEVPHVPQFNRW